MRCRCVNNGIHVAGRLCARSIVAVIALLATMALAQSWPDKPVRIIVPFTAGTGMDILARALAGPLGQRLGQPIVVENKPGASGIIGSDFVAKAPPDGYTLMITANSFVIVPALQADLPYDAVDDFTAICEVAVGNLALVTHPSLGVSSIAQFVALVKRQPGKLNYASPGNGTPHHLAMELLKQSTGLDVVHIPYKGSAGAVTDVVGGQVPMMILPVHVAMPFVAAGRLNVLAVSGDKRSAQAPAVPTFREAGIENFDVDLWYGLFAPARTPRDVVSRLQQAVAAVMAQPDIRETLTKQGMTPAVGTPEQLAAMIKPDLARWRKVVTEAKIKAD